jgi:hypothetical protein
MGYGLWAMGCWLCFNLMSIILTDEEPLKLKERPIAHSP